MEGIEFLEEEGKGSSSRISRLLSTVRADSQYRVKQHSNSSLSARKPFHLSSIFGRLLTVTLHRTFEQFYATTSYFLRSSDSSHTYSILSISQSVSLSFTPRESLESSFVEAEKATTLRNKGFDVLKVLPPFTECTEGLKRLRSGSFEV